MFQRIFIVALIILNTLPIMAQAQKPVRVDIESFIQNIPVLPATAEEVHKKYTIKTKYGDKFDDGKVLSTIHNQLKAWISSIHDAAIRKKIKEAPRNDMTLSVQYEDERLKLSLRPLKGVALLKNNVLIKALGQEAVNKLVKLEREFDCGQYHKEDRKIFKMGIQKQAALESQQNEQEERLQLIKTETGWEKDADKLTAIRNQAAKEKVAISLEIYRQHAEKWQGYFTKYCAAATWLNQLLKQIQYGENAADEVKVILADLQARSLEALEQMVWQQMGLALKGELAWGEQMVMQLYNIK